MFEVYLDKNYENMIEKKSKIEKISYSTDLEVADMKQIKTILNIYHLFFLKYSALKILAIFCASFSGCSLLSFIVSLRSSCFSS